MNWRDGLEQPLLPERLDAIVKRPDPGQHQGPRAGRFLRALGNAHFRANLEQGLVDAAQVAGAVVNQGNHARRVVRGVGLGKRRSRGRRPFQNQALRHAMSALAAHARPTPSPGGRYQHRSNTEAVP